MYSPTDALIELVVWGALRRQSPVGVTLTPLTHLRITRLPQKWPHKFGQRVKVETLS